jgi:mxaK protein
MSMSSLSRTARCSIALAVLLLALLAYDGLQLQRQGTVNARILAQGPQALTEHDPLEVVHAEALRRAHVGATREAHDLYAQVALQGSATLRRRAEYNHATLLLREALELREADDARAMPVVELAKAWDARYNLERALRLAPEPPEVEEGEGPAPQQRERAPTTMRGDSLGLP